MQFLLLFALFLGCAYSALAAFDLTCNDNSVMYWGQNAVSDDGGTQKPLATYCADPTIDVFILAFLYIVEDAGDQPRLDFSNACSLGADPTYAGTNLVQCKALAADIQTCQSLGKTVILSIGGATGLITLGSASQATQFADKIWNEFLGGSSTIRPFGNVVLDGIDLDFESGNGAFWIDFVNELRSHYDSSSRKYYLTAAPQCPFPDVAVGSIISAGFFDAVWVQFYNNFCNLNTPEFNFATWDNWAKTTSPNKNVKVFVGTPGSTNSAGSGYVGPNTLATILQSVQAEFPSMGGVMMWDVSSADANNKYEDAAKNALTKNGKCSGSSSPPPANNGAGAPTRTVCPAKNTTPASLPPSSTTTAKSTPTPPPASGSAARPACPAKRKRSFRFARHH